ncbi:C4-dicarboxylate transporter large subunit, permease [Pseudomonas fragi]|uniref:C4-dicarboxylate transporter large subunit, permease n=1 Tax=Pseudomonas fragi TaxID=296 RepID=A0A449IG19_PSEFR|nr:C4-dicarboxylate transporter large subunit, permease [Pseudomonas fragi]
MLLLLGTLMDMAPLILMPVIINIGVDPVHFGMIILVNLGIGLITPPVGAVLFVGAAVGTLNIESTVQSLLPFYLGLLRALMLVTYIPAVSLWLPNTRI